MSGNCEDKVNYYYKCQRIQIEHIPVTFCFCFIRYFVLIHNDLFLIEEKRLILILGKRMCLVVDFHQLRNVEVRVFLCSG